MLLLFLIKIIKSIEITIPNVNELVAVDEYKGRTDITKVIISEGIRIISTQAFRGCGNLQTVVFPSTLTHIKQSAFHSCLSLSNINLNEGLTTIDNYAFNRCTELCSINFPSTLKAIGVSVFTFCNSLSIDTITFDSRMNYYYEKGVMYSKDKKMLMFAFTFISSLDILASVEYIQTEAIVDCSYLTEITIPSKVKALDRFMAIANCENLTKIKFGQSLEKVESNALVGLYALQTIEIDVSNPYLTVKANVLFTTGFRELLFYPLGIKNTTFQVPNSTIKISIMTFFLNRHLSDFTVEEGSVHMKSIDGVLYSMNEKIIIKCPPMKVMSQLPATVEIIEEGAFYNCQKLTQLSINNNHLAEIRAKAFSTAILPSNIIIPKTVRSIQREIFAQTSIASCEFEEGSALMSIDVAVFTLCGNLKSFKFPDSELIDRIPRNSFSFCSSLATISISSNIKYIGDGAFKSAFSLQNVDFPLNLIEIGISSFEGCIGLTEITVPFITKIVGNSAFLSCTNIITATLMSCNTIVEKDAFLGCSKLDRYTCKATKSFTSPQIRNVFFNLKFEIGALFSILLFNE